MGGTNLEVFKFGLYIMFPIAWMYYFGTNLDERFSVPDFWPKPEATYKIPYEKSEIQGELDRLRRERLYRRQQRLVNEGMSESQANALLAIPTGQGKSAGGPLDNSAAAGVDSVRRAAGGLTSWFGKS